MKSLSLYECAVKGDTALTLERLEGCCLDVIYDRYVPELYRRIREHAGNLLDSIITVSSHVEECRYLSERRSIYGKIISGILELARSDIPEFTEYVPEDIICRFEERDKGGSSFSTVFERRIFRLERLMKLMDMRTRSDTVNKICRYLVKSIASERGGVTLDDISRRFFLNKKYISTLFREAAGIRYVDYVKMLRIERAKKLLSSGGRSVFEIAHTLGYKDVEYFSKVFKDSTGSSPSVYKWKEEDDKPGIGELPVIRENNREVVLGVISAFTGRYGFICRSKKEIYEAAADAINASGGIDGRRLRLVFRDYCSVPEKAGEEAEDLIENEHIDALIGGYLSSAREIIRPVIDKHRILYLYDSLYEGGLADHYTFVTASMPEQNLLPAIQYLMRQGKRKFYIIATDYNYGILSGEYARSYIIRSGAKVVGLEYAADIKSDFNITIENINLKKPDVLVAFFVGEGQNRFFEQWREKKRCELQIVCPTCITQAYLHRSAKKNDLDGLYFSAAYTEEQQYPEAARWRDRIRRRYGTNIIPYLGSDHETAWITLFLYRNAVEKCHTTDTETVIRTLESGEISLDAPGGRAVINPADHHLIRDIYIFGVDGENHVYEIEKLPMVRSEFVREMLKKNFGVESGLKDLGINSPNVQYNYMFYKI